MTTEQETQETPKFEIRGFDMSLTGDEAKPGEITLTAEQADAMGAGPLPPEIATEAEAPEEGAPTAEAAAPKEAAKIKIGAKEFTSTDAAWAYAQELEQEKLVADAFRHGIETAAKAAPGNFAAEAPPAPKPKADFYSNPDGWREEVIAEAEAKASAKIAQMEQAKRNEETWTEFYRDYPDLDQSRLLVRAVLDTEWSALEKVETKKALKIIAEKARAEKQKMFTSSAQGTVLPKVTHTASPTGGPEVTRSAPESRTLSFVEQMKQNNKKRSARGVRR